MREDVEIHLGCPHCHEDIKFRYEAARTDRTILRRLEQMLLEIASLEFRLAACLFGRRGELDKLTEVASRLLEALRR